MIRFYFIYGAEIRIWTTKNQTVNWLAVSSQNFKFCIYFMLSSRCEPILRDIIFRVSKFSNTASQNHLYDNLWKTKIQMKFFFRSK